MKLSYNRLIIYTLLSALGFSQNPSPYRYSLKSTTDGETSFFEDGFNSNVVAEIKLMSDSLTWFGTGRGLSLYDGKSAFTYQSTTDSIVDIFTNPSSVTSVLPSGGVSAIATSNDTLLVAFAGDDNNTPLGLGLAIAFKAGSWYETEPTEIMSFDFLWDSLAVDTLNGVYFGFDSEYEIGTGYKGTFIVLCPLTEAVKTTISDSVKTNTIIKITNSDLSKTLSFTVQSITDYSTAQVQLIIQSGSINYSSINDVGFLNGETVKLNITKATKAIAWQFLPQPVDTDLDIEVPFGEGYFWQLPVTVSQANVTYDASISGKYLYVASWAGGLRRYDLSINLRKPQNIPMPMDWQSQLSTCQDSAYIDTLSKITGDPISVLKNYYLNPRDPADGGNHNHKAFSVLAYDNRVWVGTANGLNKGRIVEEIIQISENEYEILSCIEWDHYKYPSNGISGNFVVALGKQIWNNQTTIWAATVSTGESGENQGLSYSRDDGASWKTALLGERVYNIDAKDSLVFVSTSSGLWKSLDGENWAKFDPAIEKSLLNQRQILTNSVYAAKIDSRDSIPKLWVGTPDGVALSLNTQGDDWKIFQADHDIDEVYAYPNPFSPLTHNMLDSDGYVRFHVGNIVNKEVKIDIFNFAMEKVHSKTYNLNSYYGAIKWDGRDMLGNHVANGVYFIRINYSKSRNQSPGDNWTKLIIVK
ncbi:hypothetical protein N9I45_00170 [bacterium]|nr:hypothetical protein [bacterium]MDA9934985.1 hypothetical protein [Candidatus Neomarinimicrobiota bacterium]